MILTVSRFYNSIKSCFKKISSASVILLALGIFVTIINPLTGLIPSGCIFKKLTGYYCPGCGMTTGLYALVKGDITSAAGRNILIVTLMPAAVVFIIFRKIVISFNDSYNSKYEIFIILFFIISIVIFTILRNIPNQVFDILRPH